MNKFQSPILKKGDEFPKGKIEAIKNDHVLVSVNTGKNHTVKQISFKEAESFINVK